MIGAMICIALGAINIWAYLTWGDPLNLAVAFFCGGTAALCAVMDR